MLAACLAAKADDIRGHIVDAGSNDAVAYATVTITVRTIGNSPP